MCRPLHCTCLHAAVPRTFPMPRTRFPRAPPLAEAARRAPHALSARAPLGRSERRRSAVSHARRVGASTLTIAAIGALAAGGGAFSSAMPFERKKNPKKQRAGNASAEARRGASGAGASPRARGTSSRFAAKFRPATFARQRARPSCSSPSMPPVQGQRALPCPPSPVRRHRRRRRHRRGWWRHRQARRFRAARPHPLRLCPWTSSRRPRALVRSNVVTARMASSGLREDACVGRACCCHVLAMEHPWAQATPLKSDRAS